MFIIRFNKYLFSCVTGITGILSSVLSDCMFIIRFNKYLFSCVTGITGILCFCSYFSLQYNWQMCSFAEDESSSQCFGLLSMTSVHIHT